jgi:CBS domain-containing protein
MHQCILAFMKEIRELTAEDIMSTTITTVSPDEKITAAEITMIKKNIGGLPVVNPDKTLIGILTHRDIQLSRFSALTEGAFHVDDLMSKNPITCKKTDKFPEIVKKMVENNIERIPIIDENNRVVGIIVPKDIIAIIDKWFKSA